MTYTNTKDYIRRKLYGEKIVSPATYLGYKAITTYHATDNFMVVVMNMNDFSYYVYNVIDGKFRINHYEESLPHNITDVITVDFLQDSDAMRWWKCIFYEHDNLCTYDTYYDDLKISERSDITFKEILEKLSCSISSFQLPNGVSQLFLTGDLSNNLLLRYVLQCQLAPKIAHVFPDFTGNDIANENEIVILPKERLEKIKLNVNESVNLATLVATPLHITLPLDSIGHTMLPDKKWEDVVNKQADYSVADLAFKTVCLQVECDCFQNIFLSCHDLRGNRKVIQLN